MTDTTLATDNDALERARRYVDANILDDLTVETLSIRAGLSAFHFTRQFSARYGVGPMAYVRQRRMASASARLCSATPPTLINLAFDCGFDSQEGFTRAFKRAFGVTPGRYRQSGARATFEEPNMTGIQTRNANGLSQAPTSVWKPALRLAGIAEVFTDETKAGIPGLWDRFVSNLPLPGQAGGGTFGACMASDEAGSLRYLAAVAIRPGDIAPEGMEVVDLAARAYLVFRQVLSGGPLHPQMQAAMREIWGDRLPKSGFKLARAPDLEVYPADFDPTQAGASVEWWIPVET